LATLEASRQSRQQLKTLLDTEVLVEDSPPPSPRRGEDAASDVEAADAPSGDHGADSGDDASGGDLSDDEGGGGGGGSGGGGGNKVKLVLRVDGGEGKVAMMGRDKPFSLLKAAWCASQGYAEADVTFE
jgi:hypothetical protein